MNYTPLAMTTVVVAVGAAEATRFVNVQWAAGHPTASQDEKKAHEVRSVMSPVIGGFVLGIFLFAIGMMSEDIGTKICVLIMVASLVKHGIPLLTLLGKA